MAKNRKRWTGGIATAITLALLLFNHLTRDQILLVCGLLWCCLVYASSDYMLRGSSPAERIGRWILAPAFWAIAVAFFGTFFWPPVLLATPKRVAFSKLPMTSNQQYEFKLTNESSDDVYLAELDLTFDDPQNALPNTPLGSLPLRFDVQERPLGDSSINDVIQLVCKDTEGRPLYIFSIEHLNPGESRRIRVTYSGPAGPAMTGETGYYTTEASPTSSDRDDSNTAGRMLHFSHPMINGSCGFVRPSTN